MNSKVIMAGMIIGSYAGSAIPMLWGADMFSMQSILWSGVGGLFGIWLGWKIGKMVD